MERLEKFVRRFKRKGGEGGKPGDVDALCAELVELVGEDIGETLKRFFDGEEKWD